MAIPQLKDGEADDELSKSELFDLLRNRRRRDVLRYLLSVDRTVTVSELSERIAASENGVTVAEIDSTQRKRVYVALYQTHLPKLDRAGVLEYERGRGTAVLSERASEFEPYLGDESNPTTDGSDWLRSRSYLRLSATGGAAVLIVHAVGHQAPSLRLSLLSSFLVVFLLVSFVHVYSRRSE